MPTPNISRTATAESEDAAGQNNELHRDRIRLLLDTIPVAVLNCDANGLIEYFNAQAVALWGRIPAVHNERERYCGSFRILRTTGEPLLHRDGPMADALRTGVPQLNQECVVERPDGTRVIVLVNVVPHRDADGHVMGAVSCMLDISERKRTEELLRAREQEFRTIVENTPDLIVRYDRDLRRTFVNRAMSVLYGLPKKALLGELAGAPAERAAHEVSPPQLDTFRKAIRRAFDTGEPEALTMRWLGTESRKDFNFFLAPERDSDGAVVSILGLARDVSELKESERALQRAQSYLAEGQRLTHTGSWAWDVITGQNLYWSEETFRIFGMEPVGTALNLLARADYREMRRRLHPDDEDSFERAVCQAVKDRRDFETDYRIVLPDGRVKHIHSCGHPVVDENGRAVEVVGTVMDVTERKLSDALLAAERETLDMIAHDAPLPTVLNALCSAIDEQSPGVISTILLLDSDGRRLWPTAGPRSPAAWDEFITPVEIGPNMGSCGTAAYLRQGVIVSNIENDPRWVDFRAQAVAAGLRACWSLPIFSATGQVLGTFAMYHGQPRSPQRRDLLLIDRATHMAQIAIERVRAHESLREAQMNLARIGRITTVGELTAAIAHEVNQPLAAVETNASACIRWLSATPPNLDEARRAAGRIAQDAKRAGDIITRIRGLLRKGETEKTSVDLNEIIAEIIMFTRAEVSQANVTLETKLMPGLPRVRGDRVQLQQVILNLVMNAIESLTLIDVRPRQMSIGTDCPAPDVVRVGVRDAGVGLTPEQMARLCEAFYTTKPCGLGMGLSISRSIVETHGGRLWAEPNQGPGVTFYFTLPSESEGNR